MSRDGRLHRRHGGKHLFARVLVIMLVAAMPLRLSCQAVPSPAAEGLDFLIRGQPDSAVALWTATWVRPEDDAKKQQLLSSLRQLPEVAGHPLGYDLIRVIDLTPHLRRVYVLLRCQRLPLYFSLVLYEARDRWTVNNINWQTDADKVLPPALFGAEHPVRP
jgi:hypothetical protein